ncbi:PDZ domain-containing protein 8 isoform X2 [Apis mellifera]|uniref:PDZ domain-containing protein 8 isoform X2 n=1 Tax=Apis mellifera TaxID=7460 RepID=A0A7M7L2N3_APIME|nr:PDZ domain-containing protein 8 isoform X2 [Apis mellifera]|eukprot:XP_026295636.1 PDZ domain-containing protein 8 isoform X2 [Apis mellifera]
MDIFEFICVSVITFMCGIICTIVLEFYFFKKFLEQAPLANSPKKSLHHDKAQLPKELLEKIQDEKTNSINISRQGMCQGNENLAINLTLQFLFNELRNAERVRLWLYRKLNNEFKELLTQSTTGKLLDSVQLRDLNLGSQFPTIKGLEVADSKIDADTGLLETLDLSLDLHYSGNFQLSIDVKMLLGKTAYMALQVKRISGRARLQFTRVPYTHWSLSFYSDPILELEVQSQFQGRQLQPQIISLITGQIRRAVRRKHTLPRYKMRYKPFFRRLNDEAVDLSEVANMQLIPGYLEVSLVEITRLNLGPNILNAEDRSQVEIYCTISIDSTPWVYLTQYTGVPYMVLDLIISKVGSQQLGVVFKQEFVPEIGHTCVLVETIIVGSPAAIAEMKKGDILIAVDGKKVSNMNQVAKFVKSAVQRRFIIRVERKYSKTDLDKQTSMKLDSEKISAERGDKKTLKIDSISNKGDTPSAEDSKIKFETQIKFSDLKDYENEIADKLEMGNKFFRRRKSSAHTDDTAQTPDTTPSRKISTTSNQSISSNSQFCFNDSYVTNISDLYYTTKEKEYASLITFEETRTFQIDSELQYLNIGVWGRVRGGEIHPKLLGYINVPMKLILAQCYTSSTGHYLKCHALLPPDSASLTTVHPKLQGYSGFDPTLCYGDILLSYIWESNYSNRHMLDMGKKENIEAIKTQPSLSEEIIEKKMHDFIRTHFHRATHCDFCTKKIWLKDAVQCRDCGMVCHKKCEVRCQASGMCGAESITTMALEADEIEPTLIGESGPEISLTSCEDTVQNSLVGGLGISPDLLEGAEPSVAAPLVAGDLDDGLMSRAKDTGKFLYKNLEPQERVEKINIMMGKLKTALDAETTSRLELSQSGEMDSIKLIAQSDLRVQALSVLLLHYCAGLQHAQEVLDRSQKNKES